MKMNMIANRQSPYSRVDVGTSTRVLQEVPSTLQYIIILPYYYAHYANCAIISLSTNLISQNPFNSRERERCTVHPSFFSFHLLKAFTKQAPWLIRHSTDASGDPLLQKNPPPSFPPSVLLYPVFHTPLPYPLVHPFGCMHEYLPHKVS
jgi:hypothetical protein